MKKDTSWENSSEWYSKAVGVQGHYYHTHVILPKGIPLLDLKQNSNLLDFGCGQGILARAIPKEVGYTGVDLSPSLIKEAERLSKNRKFIMADATKPLALEPESFTHAASILAFQNMENQAGVLENAARYLKPRGQLLLVLNHPCFRIPRKSSWGYDDKNKIQYRCIDAYMSDLKIPIEMQPSKRGASPVTYSFHHALSTYSSMLRNLGFVITAIEEWCSDKKSEGGRAKAEDKARDEIPLFLALLCRKDINND